MKRLGESYIIFFGGHEAARRNVKGVREGPREVRRGKGGGKRGNKEEDIM